MAFIRLDDIELIKRLDEEGATVEIRSVHEVQVSAKRKVVELPVPGSPTNIFQDMGRNPCQMRLEGRLVGKGAAETLKTIRAKFNSGEPVPFSSDLSVLEDVTTVIFEGLSVRVLEGVPLEIHYTMLLREAKPPPEEGEGGKGAPDQKEEAAEEVSGKTKEIKEEVKETKEEVKEEAKEVKEEVKETKEEVKEEAKEVKEEVKETTKDLREEYKGLR